MATIRDIAKEAGVSPGAVSRILNNDATLSVSPATRKAVVAVANKLNYKKSPRINTVSRAKFSMGIVQWFSADEEANDNYYLLARQGVEDFCAQHSINIVRVFRGDSDGFDRLKGVDGLICLGKFSDKEINKFIEICRNIVFLDMPVEKYNITSLSMDFEHAVYSVLDYLVGLGHTKIAFLGGQEYVGDGEALKDPRTITYKKYMSHRKYEYKTFMKIGSFSMESGYKMMSDIIAAKDIPTAVFCASDNIATGAMKAIHENGLRIPEDISIVGFNNIKTSEFLNPPLTTVNAPSYDMGQHGANLVYAASNLKISTPIKATIPCELVIRSSCKSV